MRKKPQGPGDFKDLVSFRLNRRDAKLLSEWATLAQTSPGLYARKLFVEALHGTALNELRDEVARLGHELAQVRVLAEAVRTLAGQVERLQEHLKDVVFAIEVGEGQEREEVEELVKKRVFG